MKKLGVNVDHVATLRQARGGKEPDPIWAAALAELAGCDSIVVHLREDRRHINERDLRLLKQIIKTRLNLEMSQDKEIVEIACKIKPHQVTLVPERRRELTTEGGLDVKSQKKRLSSIIKRLKEKNIRVSIFIDPEESQIISSQQVGAELIELHTGKYALSKDERSQKKELDKLIWASAFSKKIGLRVNAGHGLNYHNVRAILTIPEIEELNIGHAIVSRAIFVGFYQAVKEMLSLIKR